jgi:hypothetical protein
MRADVPEGNFRYVHLFVPFRACAFSRLAPILCRTNHPFLTRTQRPRPFVPRTALREDALNKLLVPFPSRGDRQ